MDIRQIQESMQQCSGETERIYTRMGTCFPSLLSITKDGTSASLPALKRLFTSLSEGFSGHSNDEVRFFEAYNRKNESLFSSLNEKMDSLGGINERVGAIRTDSEELEIISLNAMVISIKSGEKGRAFSCITENLKSLSARMIALSNELILDEKRLLERNETLKESFQAVLSAQKNVLDTHAADSESDIAPVLSEASLSLGRMIENALEVSAPILEAMSGIQLQDIIRQSIDQILLALPELQGPTDEGSVEERLDRLTLDADLLDICLRISGDVLSNLDSSLSTFSSNWTRVHEILDSVERSRVDFIDRYLDTRNQSGKSIPAILDAMTNGFAEYISHINLYQRGQKTMVRESSLIVTQVKHLRILFDSIKPIIARLQHVRITQQIEVAKNPAIAAVKDTVDHMSELIMQADARVQDTRKELEEFIEGIDSLTSNYSADSETDQRSLEKIKQEKTLFFGKMREYQDELARNVVHLEVYPDSFQSLCAEIDSMLGELTAIRDSVGAVNDRLGAMYAHCTGDRDRLLAESGLADWQIHDDRFRAMIERFTITSHKEAGGEIGGFDVDKGLDSIESGDVTLFF